MDQNLVNDIQGTAELLYQQKIKEGYEKLGTTLPLIAQYADQLEDADQKQDLLAHLQEALKAMESGDTTLLADILQYELSEMM